MFLHHCVPRAMPRTWLTADAQGTLVGWLMTYSHISYSTISSLRAGTPFLNSICLTALSRGPHTQVESGANLNLDCYLCKLSKSKALGFYTQYVYWVGYMCICVYIHRFYCISSLALVAKNPRGTRFQEDELSFWCVMGSLLTQPFRSPQVFFFSLIEICLKF